MLLGGLFRAARRPMLECDPASLVKDMIDAALAAFLEMFSAPFRSALYKTLGVTVGLLALVWVLLAKAVAGWIVLSSAWLSTLLSLTTGIGLLVALFFAIPPVSFIAASFFLDDLADIVEAEIAPLEGPGRRLPIGEALWLGAKFAGVALAVNIVALLLFLVPGVNAIVFFGANAYLLGRGYFEFAALRHRPLAEVHRLRRQRGVEIFVAGLIMAALFAVPILNLMTPLFAASFMVRLYDAMARRAQPGALQAAR